MLRRRTAQQTTAWMAVALGSLVLGAPQAFAQKDFNRPPQMDASPPPTTNARNTRFTLINNSDQIIDNLNISPTSDDSWGVDLFGTLSLPPDSRVIAGPTQTKGCLFDVRVVYHDHREEVLRRQDLCNLQELSFTGHNARRPRARSQSDD